MSLKDFAQKLSTQVEIMEDREKGDVNKVTDVEVTITDFDFLTGQDGDYAVFILSEEPSKFFFGGKVITNHLQEIQKEGYKEAVQAEGLPVKFVKEKSKNGFTYTNAVLYPSEQ